MSSGRATAAIAVVLVAACAAPARGLDESSSEQWTAIATPISRAALLAALDVDPRLPRTLTFIEAVRRLHDDDLRRGRMRAAVAASIAASTPGSRRRTGKSTSPAMPAAAPHSQDTDDDLVPLPLTEGFWRSCVLGPRQAAGSVSAAVLTDPAVGLMYLALASTDGATRTFLRSQCGTITTIARGRAAAFSLVARSVRVRDGRIVPPAGDAAQALWERLVGEPVTRPAPFLLRLVSVDGGRLAYFYDAIAQLDSVRQRFALGLGEPQADTDSGVAVYHVCAEADPSWAIADRPFLRMAVDVPFVLQQVRLTPDARLVGPATEGFLNAAFADGEVDRGQDQASALVGGPTADAAAVLRLVLVPDAIRRRARLLTLLFAQRVFPQLQPAEAPDALVALRGIAKVETLPFALERMQVHEPAVFAAAVRRAMQFGTPVGGTAAVPPERLRAEISAFQGSIALLERLVSARTLDGAAATALVRALLDERTPHPLGYPAHVARWLEHDLLPQVVVGAHSDPGRRPVVESAEGPDRVVSEEGAREHDLLDALAGMGTGQPEAVTWEGVHYRVDVPSADRARFRAIRERQGGARLDDALDLIAAALALRQGTEADDLASVRVSLSRMASTLPPPDFTDSRSAAAGADAQALVAAAAHALEESTNVTPSIRVHHARRLAEVGSVLLGDVLRSIVYACALDDAEGQAFLAGDVSRLHEFGLEEMDPSRRRVRTWELPTDIAAGGQPWHLSGSLVAIDLTLSRFALRRSLGDMPARQPTLSGADRRTLVSTVALMNPADMTERTRAELIAAIGRGRAVLNEALAHGDPLDDVLRPAGIAGWRAQLIEWAHRFEPAAAMVLVARSEFVWLGTREPIAPGADAWGGPAQAIDGAWALRFPPRESIDLLAGRQASGYFAARFVDLTLRVAELTADLRFPPSLAREVLRIALQRFVDDVRLAHGDDWLAMVRYADAISRTELEDYVYGLTVPGGPLVPANAPTGQP